MNIKRTSNEHRTNINKTLKEHQTNIKGTSNEHRMNNKRTSNEQQTNIEHTSNEHWTNIKWITNKHQMNIERTSTEHWSKNKSTLKEHDTKLEWTSNKFEHHFWTLNILNVFIYWQANSNALFLVLNEQALNIKPNRAITRFARLLIVQTWTSFFWTSNELKCVHLLVIDLKHPIFGFEQSSIVHTITKNRVS